MDVVEMINRGQQNAALLDEAEELKQAALALLREQIHLGCDSVLASTQAGERVVGAAMMLGKLSLRTPRNSRVMIFDVNLASGTQMRRAAQIARQAGAAHVVGLVLHLLGEEVPDAKLCDLDELYVMDRHETRLAIA